jgi:hypothetical protein
LVDALIWVETSKDDIDLVTGRNRRVEIDRQLVPLPLKTTM